MQYNIEFDKSKQYVLDGFCCAGGSAKGIHDAGFEIIGVDIDEQKDYPYQFIKEDFFKLDLNWIKENFVAVWTSPKCQKFSQATNRKIKETLVDQIPPTRQMLKEIGLPSVIENVLHAPIRHDLTLCGTMFDLQVKRHRFFEIEGFKVKQLQHPKHKKRFDYPIEVKRNIPEGLIETPLPITRKHSSYACVVGHGGDSFTYKLDDWKRIMQIDWITDRKHLVQCIPPKYSEYIFNNFKKNEKC